MLRQFTLANNAPMGLYIGASTSNTTKAYAFDLRNFKSKLISDPDKEHQDKLLYGKASDWNFINTDGTTIYGRCFLPTDFDSTKKYPLIVYYYGGTTPTSRSYEHN